jgi:hypothetical protein
MPHSLNISEGGVILPGDALDDQASALVFSPQSTGGHRVIGKSKRSSYVQAQRGVWPDGVNPERIGLSGNTTRTAHGALLAMPAANDWRRTANGRHRVRPCDKK